ncbi:MAG TPA: type II secretion system protein GspG [Deltaproteobacteria bacterium]|nr:MAG: type II secretion system protein GspG [Deltaproteobacteria bacterium GWA2_45_12]HBF13927.1 type II secretion system protein GspG [Deltaproteobacteria bacterium]
MKKWFKNESGMTLIEIMVVVAIIAGITGLIAVNVVGRREKANIQLTQTQISNLMNALDQYKLDNHFYPSSEQGLQALVEKPGVGRTPQNYPEDGYLKKVPKDAWGQGFEYAAPGSHGNAVEIWSMGPDGQEGNEDDIKSWDSEGE